MQRSSFLRASLFGLLLVVLVSGCNLPNARKEPADGGAEQDAGTEVDAGRPATVTTALAPSQQTVALTATLHAALPGVAVRYGAVTGEISAVASPALVSRENPATAAPLAESRGTTETARAEAMLEFFTRFKGPFHLENAEEELQLRRDPTNDGQFGGAAAQSQELGQAAGLQVQSLQRMFKGVPVYGQHATGLFDPAGNLHALNARLLPMDAALDVTPNLTASGAVAALQGFQGSLDVTVFGQDGKPEASSVDRSEALSPDAQSAELMLLPVERGSGRVGAVSSKVDYRLAWDLHLRKGLLQIHAFVDARSGEIL
ncbi:MAG: hypothetical protein RL653_4563, partial [Pseudomonadota bacterium]